MANDDAPPLDEQARSIARLSEHPDAIADPALRAFIDRVKARVSQLKEEAEGKGQTDSKNVLVVDNERT